MKEISAGGVVYRKEGDRLELLMIEDRYGKWTLPKGKQEAGEEVEETALREIREETGLRGRIVRPLMTVNYQYDDPEGEQSTKTCITFLCSAPQEMPPLNLKKSAGWSGWRRKKCENGSSNTGTLTMTRCWSVRYNWWNTSERSCGDDGTVFSLHHRSYAVKTGRHFGSD
ncbi:NUDIX hydrolase [Novibacillus thermophilus]|uniref:Nudix hydrolase domain-containing protein n=1 Tax=Novibacillus thermophilus TaxID=1471761 RepID=A0A1U9K5P3_9BACL|nr:NUDIX domain-containing protein [Novibacillus thermophilus]AQS55348.1 hypothetical protein B0W44_05680 [Novibacillus thermophilus]